MPFYHKPRGFTPLSVANDKKAIKNGLHHTIFTSRFDRYVGDWKNDLKEGKGRFMTIAGKLYEGDWYKGNRHGFGVLSHRRQDGTFSIIYRGEWVRGKYEGSGWEFHENGDIYLGFYKKGKKHGFGNMWYADGTYYCGYFIKDKKEGLGMFVLADGNRYEGNWENGMKNGLGRYYHMHTGQLQEGCWVDDVCVKSKMTDIIIRQSCSLPTPYPIPEARAKKHVELNKPADVKWSFKAPEGNLTNHYNSKTFSTLCMSSHKRPDAILQHQLKYPRYVLECSEFWMNQKLGEIDKNLKYCLDQMY